MGTDSSGGQGRLHDLELRLPPLPQTLPYVLKLLHEPGFVSPEAMTEAVERDPAVVARLLKHINSAYYGLRRSVTSVERAIRLMGPTSAAGRVIGLNMLRMRELMDGPAGPCFTRLIRHSEGTAFLTRFLLDRLPSDGASGQREVADEEGPVSDGFAEGLLHDFGKLVLIYNSPSDAVALYEEEIERPDGVDECELERHVFGCDHTEAGTYAATEMGLPSPIVDVIRHHHEPEEAPAENTATWPLRAVCGANQAAKAMGSAVSGVRASGPTIDWETCAEHPIWSYWPERPKALMKKLRAKREEIVLFTKFFLGGPDTSVPTRPAS